MGASLVCPRLPTTEQCIHTRVWPASSSEMVSLHSTRNKIRTTTVVCISFLLLVTATLVQCLGRGTASLFELSEHVQELNEESLAAIQDDPDQRWAINAYSPGCPHCRRFAPKVSWLRYTVDTFVLGHRRYCARLVHSSALRHWLLSSNAGFILL